MDAPNNAPAPGTPEHDALMANKFVQGGGQAGNDPPTPTPQDNERPQWLPEKFKSPEDLAKAYAELESKLGQKPNVDPAKDPPKDQPKDAPPAGIDVDAMSDEVAKDGKLSDASVTALKAKGYSDAEIKAFVDGQVALAEKAVQSLYAVAGGEETFNQVQAWAAQTLSDAEKQVYHAALEGDMNSATLAIQNLVLRYQQANGQMPTRSLTPSGNGATGSAAPFQSIAEQSAAINDPRYSKDPAYRAAIEKRIVASSL